MDDLYNRVARRNRKGESGFTLIELLVVIAVLAILGAIVIFNVTGVAKSGKTAACHTDVQTVQTALDQAIANNEANGGTGLPQGMGNGLSGTADIAWLVSNGYLHTSPTNCGTWTITTGTSPSGGTSYTVGGS